jgi:ABC-type oligopeptide transport system ATPase subunit
MNFNSSTSFTDGQELPPHPSTSVSEPLSVLGIATRGEKRAEARRALEAVGLDPSFVERYPHELSGGQRQRVAIARALITEPRFIVFDEAVSALDVSVQTQVLNLIKDLQQQHGFGALFISHDLAATRYVAHRMAVMYAGALMEIGPADLFYGRARHPYSRALSISVDAEATRALRWREPVATWHKMDVPCGCAVPGTSNGAIANRRSCATSAAARWPAIVPKRWAWHETQGYRRR